MGSRSEIDAMRRELTRLSEADAKRAAALAYIEGETRKEIRALEKRVEQLEQSAPRAQREDQTSW
jgi:hypothetical protein